MSIINHKNRTVDSYIHNIREMSMSKSISWVEKMARRGNLSVRTDSGQIVFVNSIGEVQENILKKYIDYMTILFKNLEHIYPGKWDMHVEKDTGVCINEGSNGNFSTDNYVSNYYCVSIQPIIHYDKINIVNDDEEEHEIRDLIVRLRINYDIYNKLFALYDISGLRSTLSFGEWNVGYLHSHLSEIDHQSPIVGMSRFKEFCIGSGDIAFVMNDLNDPENTNLQYDDNGWGMFFSILETMISWESIEGGPYIYIEKITESTSFVSVPHNLIDFQIKEYSNQIYLDLLNDKFKTISPFNFSYNSGSFYVNFTKKHIEEIKKTIVATMNSDTVLNTIIRVIRGNTYGYVPTNDANALLTSEKTLILDEKPYFFMSGEKIYLEIKKPENNNDDNNISNFHIRKEILKNLKNEFNKTIYKQQIIEKAS